MNSFYSLTDISLAEFARLCEQPTDIAVYPHAAEVVDRVVVYRQETIRTMNGRDLRSELVHCLKDGPGVLVVRGAFEDLSIVDRCNEVFASIVNAESATGQNKGDHFGKNQRIWNSLQKTCLSDPHLFAGYFGNPVLHVLSHAWLGPGYRITSQMNTIKPGGAAQSPHRDYHLGFQSIETIADFPIHAQQMSQCLTLQAAVAHVDMPIESGSTLLLPFSQQYPLGYLATGLPEFFEYFDQHHVQLPLAKGDALFFNPALIHAGGTNRSAIDRIANLIQVSSMFGRTMESINYRAMIEAIYPVLLRMTDDVLIRNVIATIADGYSFPTNLDSDPPIDGLAPITQQQIVQQSLQQRFSIEKLGQQLNLYDQRRSA